MGEVEWLRLPLGLGIGFLSAFGAFYLATAWKRRWRKDAAVDALLALLPGHNCGLCGTDDCRHYARELVENGADPALCAPGGKAVEASLRTALGDERKEARIAVVRCGGRQGEVRELFAYDGRADCWSAARLYGGSRACADACLGLGSCRVACPLGAISIDKGLALVDPELCSGCGRCVVACPKGLIALVPRTARWFVACSSHRPPESRKADCTRACDACGECARLSPSWEFSLEEGRARASTRLREDESSAWAAIAARCPSGAIVRSGGTPELPREKKVKSASDGGAAAL